MVEKILAGAKNSHMEKNEIGIGKCSFSITHTNVQGSVQEKL